MLGFPQVTAAKAAMEAPHKTSFPIRSTRVVKVAALLLLVIALAAAASRELSRSHLQFVGAHAMVSADISTTARIFATEGIWKLRGVPVDNYYPIGPRDRYTHWPPLLPILLSGCFRIFGSSEHTGHIFMLCVLLTTALLIVRLAWIWLGPIGGALAGYFWLTLPAVFQYGDLIVQQSLAMLFVVGALVAFATENKKIGSALLFLAVLSSWEAALVVPGIWFASLWCGELRQKAIAASIGAGAALACVAIPYIIFSPAQSLDTLQAIKFCAGLSPTYSHLSTLPSASLTPLQQVVFIIANFIFMIGIPGGFALFRLLAVHPRSGALIVSGLAAPWIIWTTFMRTHIAIHNFEMLIAAPLAALALAWMATPKVREFWSSGALLKVSMFVVLAAVQLVVLPQSRGGLDKDPEGLIRYSVVIRDATPVGSIVMESGISVVPHYYSERHIVRGVATENDLSRVLPYIRRDYSSSPVYLAIPPVLADKFASTLSHSTIVVSTPDAIIAKL